ncbi:Ank2 [Symbiodinium microadriaticum]|nr:Ank2 [Symbiodinium microadriaticum]
MAINASRAERRTDEYLKLSTSTSDIVAPGSYEPKLGKEVGEAVAPFMSLQDKELNPLSLMAKMTPGYGCLRRRGV